MKNTMCQLLIIKQLRNNVLVLIIVSISFTITYVHWICLWNCTNSIFANEFTINRLLTLSALIPNQKHPIWLYTTKDTTESCIWHFLNNFWPGHWFACINLMKEIPWCWTVDCHLIGLVVASVLQEISWTNKISILTVPNLEPAM